MDNLENIPDKTPLESFSDAHVDRINSANVSGATIVIGMGTCGLASGAGGVLAATEEELQKRNIDARIVKTGCIGMCYQEVLMDVTMPGSARVTYHRVQPDMVPRIIRDHVVMGRPVLGYAIGQISDNGQSLYNGISTYDEVDFFSKQHRLVLRRCGFPRPRHRRGLRHRARVGFANRFPCSTPRA